MKKLLIPGFILLILAQYSTAQQKLSSPPKFHSLQQVGMINGNGAVSGLIQTINGVELNQWFAGAGVGIDFYRYRSVPLFIDVKRFFGLRNNNALFVYADAGYNQPWLGPRKEMFSWGNGSRETQSNYKGGLYSDAGLGYALRFKKGNKMLLSAGYSYKYFKEIATTKTIIGGIAGNTETTDIQQYKFNLNRLMIKIGWEF